MAVLNIFKTMVYTYGQAVHAVRRMELAKIRSYADFKGHETILDVGCGKGFFSRYIYRRKNDVYGIDPSEEDISIAKSVEPHITYVVASGENLPYKHGYFDKVVSVCVLEHTRNDLKVLKEVYRVLKKKGVFVLSVDSLSSPYISEEYTRVHRMRYKVNQLYTREKLHDLLVEAGFEVLNTEYLFSSYVSSLLLRIGSFFHFGLVFALIFPVVYPVLLVDDWLRTEKSSGFILVVKAQKP